MRGKPPSRLFERLRPLSVSHYALLFFLVLSLALGGLGALISLDLKRLGETVARTDETLAREELAEAIALLTAKARDNIVALTQWDEARMQLDNPAYYGYWRNSRALTAGVLPKTLDGIALYDDKGINLGPPVADESAMPRQLPEREQWQMVLNESGHPHAYFFGSIHRDTGQTNPIGYAGIKVDLIEELVALRKFRYLDIASVSYAGGPATVTLADVAKYLHFKTVANPEVRAVGQVMTNAFNEIAGLVAFLSLIGYLTLLAIVTRPMQRISNHIESMRKGQGSQLDASYRGFLAVTELENVRQSLNDYQQQLADMHVSLNDKNEELWMLAHHDPLTGMLNRRAFNDDWRTAHRGGSSGQVAFLLFDCDYFKAINDSYGHQVGDQVLQGLAESLHGALRTGDRLYRLGGDEFATVLYGADPDSARHVAERCVENVVTHDFRSLGIKEPVRISVGIAHTGAGAEDSLVNLHRQADLAMYQAKRPGQSKIALFSSDMGSLSEALVSSAGTSAIFDAIADPDRLEMHYQPIAALPSGKTDYHEALVRIRDGDTLIPPAAIFPVVELRGLEREFDLAVFERIHRDMTSGQLPVGSGISINVSGPSIVDAQVFEKLMRFVPMLASFKLVIEITETSLITQIAVASTNLARLRHAGFLIALDDFGSGYSSLRYLSSMPVDLVKFDISMVRSLEEGGKQALFIEDLARLIRDGGYALVAEGIESAELLEKVTALGFGHAQGWHIGRPTPLPKKPS